MYVSVFLCFDGSTSVDSLFLLCYCKPALMLLLLWFAHHAISTGCPCVTIPMQAFGAQALHVS